MEARVTPGTLLLSVPQMLDPNFMHSVVLMIEHTDQGAFGLVLNQRVDVTLDELLEGHPILDGCEFPVHSGGPVGRDNLQFVHRLPDLITGGVEFSNGLWLGGRLEELAQALAGGASEDELRFFVGYSGWGEGQLDGELATGSWVPAPSSPDLVFADLQGEAFWRLALRSLGDDGERLSQLPPDVSWN